MVEFRYACAHHQQLVIEAAKRGGCRHDDQIEEVRRKTLAFLSSRYPRLTLDHFNEGSCLGCKLRASGIDCREIGRAIVALAEAVAAAAELGDAARTPSASVSAGFADVRRVRGRAGQS